MAAIRSGYASACHDISDGGIAIAPADMCMATGAGALGISIGGDAIYHGKNKSRPSLGNGDEPKPNDLLAALKLVDRSVYIWAVLALIFGTIGFL